MKKVIYIVGRMDVPNYWLDFEKAEDDLTAEGFIPLSPSRLPHDLPKDKLTRIHTALMDVADAVLFLPGWDKSVLGQLFMAYAKGIGKPFATKIENLEVLK